MQLTEYCQQDAHDLAKLIKAKILSPEEALSFALARMHEVNPLLNAIIRDCSAWAIEQLKFMQGDEPFYGVPVVVKDLGFFIQGEPTTAGSRFFAQSIAPENSDFINRLLAFGMLPFAKTNVPELGLSYVTESLLHGPCRNPYDLTRTPGGSSGGSAAAVAAGIAPIGTANDGGGSIRIPAACCGLFGFKPTPGLTPTGPWVSEAWSGLAANHVITRSVRDSAQLFELLTAKLPLTLWTKKEKKRLKVALVDGAFFPTPVAKPCLDAVEKALFAVKTLGHQVVERSLKLNLAAIGEAVLVIVAANTTAEVERQERLSEERVNANSLEPISWAFFERGKKISAADLIRAKNTIYQLLRPLHELLEEVDVLLTPALAQLPLALGSLKTTLSYADYLQKSTEFSPFTSLFNQAGLPAMTLPVMHYNKMPVSVQFATGRYKDQVLLELATDLEKQFVGFNQPIMHIEKR